MNKDIKKIILAYSGGLDTSVILHWLKEEYGAEVVAFTADLGQEYDPSEVNKRAEQIGASKVIIENLKEEFVGNYVYPMFRANAVYEGEYLLGTSIARPLISKRLVELAKQEGAEAIAHGATGKGNDQIRFELGVYALDPEITVIAPWRTWNLKSRKDLLAYCKKYQININASPDEPLYSKDENILHTSYEGEILEDPSVRAPSNIWERTTDPLQAPDEEEIINIEFRNGDPVKVNGKSLNPDQLLQELNLLAGKNGIGRLDLVENRFTGMKSRGCYETPGGTILIKAHRAIESITLDAEQAHLKDEIMAKYSELIYKGFWWSPERKSMQTLIDSTQTHVTGSVTLSLYKGSVSVISRDSDYSLYDPKIVTFEDDENTFDQADATGFIKINSIRLKTNSKRK